VTTPSSRPPTAARAIKTQTEWFSDLAYRAWQAGQAALTAGRLDEARGWLERACRFAPKDVSAKLSLATVKLHRGDPDAVRLFEDVTGAIDFCEAWLGLAAAHAQMQAWGPASSALAAALSRHVLPVGTDIDTLALRIAAGVEAPGWCSVRADGQLGIRPASPRGSRVELRLDGQKLPGRPKTVPPRGGQLDVTQGGRHLLGSPLRLSLMRRVDGYVELTDDGIEGWAWLPANPGTDPLILLRPERGVAIAINASDTSMNSDRPMARPRRFSLPGRCFAATAGLVHVSGPDGRPLPGSPLDPGAAQRDAAAVARAVAVRCPVGAVGPEGPMPDVGRLAPLASIVGPPATAPKVAGRPIAVVVPVYRNRELTLRCLASVQAAKPRDITVIVVDDASPEPGLTASIDGFAARGEIVLVRHAANLGFPAAANAGMRAAWALPGGPDVILLNNDAVVAGDALKLLRSVVHEAGDIGTATPFSNDATILSYPRVSGGNPTPGGRELAELAQLAAHANRDVAIDIPTAVGFCMYIRRECLEQVGLFSEDLFGAGYGEENDFCIRARHLGWRHVAVPGAFVAHEGGASFGASRHARIVRNLGILERLHPGYHDLIAAFQRDDPLAGARHALDAARWAAARPRKGARSVILITHDSGGGVERVVRERCEALRAEGLRPIVLRPLRDPEANSADERGYLAGMCEVADGIAREYPNLRFAIPQDMPALVRLLRADRPEFVEIHHLLGHDHALLGLSDAFGIPWDVVVHDYAWLCPRITLLGAERRYCGEPTNPAICDACIADLGRNDEQDISVADLRARSAKDLSGARRVIAPSNDAATRLRRHFPGIFAEVRPHEDDTRPPLAIPQARGGLRRICVIGGIGPEKGYDVLLACARDAAMRDLGLEFVVVGHTVDDERLLATGRVFVTGPYQDADALDEILAQRPDIAFLPSIWPETWCYTLGHAWRAGLHVAAFDIGAPAERIRRTGRGWLLPLGLPAPSINNALLAVCAVAGDECAV
jgi:GT2 family glycosyltransferase/glycosyltransferase involved in cell wall biosynthesis